MHQYSLTKKAEEDLSKIVEYISQDSTYQADLWLDRIYNIFELIAANPELGCERSELTNKKVRFYTYGNYFIIYHEITQVEILSVVSSYRDIATFLDKA